MSSNNKHLSVYLPLEVFEFLKNKCPNISELCKIKLYELLPYIPKENKFVCRTISFDSKQFSQLNSFKPQSFWPKYILLNEYFKLKSEKK